MPIVGPAQSGGAGQAQIGGSPTICTFGNLPLPNNQGLLGNINLNDVSSWFLQDIVIGHDNRAVGISPLIARAKSVYVSDDFLNKTISLTLRYQETTNPIGFALAQLSQAGEQQLSFDGSTFILAKYHGVRSPTTYPKLIRKYPPFMWEVQLEFICREPWFKDINSTTTSAVTVVAAPSNVPGINFPSSIVGAVVGGYRVSRVEARAGTRTSAEAIAQGTVNVAARTWSLRGKLTSRTVTPAGAAIITTSGNSAASGGSMTVGTYTLAYTYVTASGETAPSPATPGAPAWAQSDYVTARVDIRAGSQTTGSSGKTGMGGAGSRTRSVSRFGQSHITATNSAITLTTGFQQIAVGAVPFPAWATAVKWYVMSGPTGTTGFTVQNINGNAFTLNTIGSGVGPPTATPATSFTITYSGSVFSEPVFTVTVPASNPNSITQLVLKNTMSTEALTISFPNTILGGRATTLTIDSSAWTVTDQAGNSYDYSGSFPNFYGPAGQSNAFTAQLVGTAADPYGVSLAATYVNRWEA